MLDFMRFALPKRGSGCLCQQLLVQLVNLLVNLLNSQVAMLLEVLEVNKRYPIGDRCPVSDCYVLVIAGRIRSLFLLPELLDHSPHALVLFYPPLVPTNCFISKFLPPLHWS